MTRTRTPPPVSNSAADRAGDVLRTYFTNPAQVESDLAIQAYVTVSTYRDMHSYPLTKVTNGVRHYIKAATGDDSLRPSQRFKRMDRIIDKLRRFPHMRLSQIEDIGGCRAVLVNLEQVYAVARKIQHRWHGVHLTDYIESPKASGYRGLHLIERRDGRLIEVQLRTASQHRWAEAVETWIPPAVPFNLKDQPRVAPEEVRRYFELVGDAMALTERGEPADVALMEEIAMLSPAISRYTTSAEEGNQQRGTP